MKCLLILTTLSLVFISCNNSSNLGKSSEEDDAAAHQVTTRDSIIVVDSITSVDTASAIMPAETIIQVPVPAETLPVTRLQKTLTSDMQSIYVTISDLDVGQLRVSIAHSKPDANIRISQVIRPDGSSDGPFGQQLVYEVKQRGNYTVVINKSNMASGTQVGDVFITLER